MEQQQIIDEQDEGLEQLSKALRNQRKMGLDMQDNIQEQNSQYFTVCCYLLFSHSTDCCLLLLLLFSHSTDCCLLLLLLFSHSTDCCLLLLLLFSHSTDCYCLLLSHSTDYCSLLFCCVAMIDDIQEHTTKTDGKIKIQTRRVAEVRQKYSCQCTCGKIDVND